MRKLGTLALIALVVATITACSKKDNNGGGNMVYNPNGMAPNSCYNSGGMMRYRQMNGSCVDTQNNSQPVSMQLCIQGQSGFSFDPRCNFTGGQMLPGMNQFNNFNMFNGFDACSQAYGYGWVTSRDMTGNLFCVNSMTWNHINSYYGVSPILMNGMYQTCLPGSPNNCNCRSFGGTLGWFQAGVSIGYCF